MSKNTSTASKSQNTQTVANTDAKNTWDDILKVVKSTPTMVFSVIGDSDSFVPRPWPKTVFQTALIEAAKSGGETWILYRGNKQGVSKVVTDAYKHYGNMEFKTEQKDIGHQDRHIKLVSIDGKETIQLSAKEREKAYIYKTKHGEGDRSEYLINFESFVSEQEVSFFSQKMESKMPIPIAIFLCEGDIDDIVHVDKALKHKLPVIVMKGSGKAADLVSAYLENPNDLRKKASVLFGIRFDDEKYEQLKEHMQSINKKSELVGVFDLYNDDPLMLSNVVGEAVVSCWSIEKLLPDPKEILVKNKKEKLGTVSTGKENNTGNQTIKDTSLAWNFLRKNSIGPSEKTIYELLEGFKKDIRPYVLNPKFSAPTSLPLYFFFGYQLFQESESLERCGPILLLEALKANRCDYVRVLLDQGVSFDMNYLPELYAQTVSCEGCEFKKHDCLHMQWILKQINEKHAERLCHVYICVNDNSNATEKHPDCKDGHKMTINFYKSVAQAARLLCCEILRYQGKNDDIEDDDTDERISDLLLWTIFANRKKLAEIFWLKSKNHLLTGLICAAILQKLSKKADNVKEQILSNELENHSKLFEQRCISIMDIMFEEDTRNAIDLMDDEATIWGIHSSPLTFAYENFMYDVVAHTCSQKNMNKQWYNTLAPDLKPFMMSAISKPKLFFTAPLTKYVFNYMMFFTMLVMYSAFVLTSISTKYYVLDIARVFEYYVYFWGAGDFIEELISCFGCLETRGRSHRNWWSRMKRYLYDFWNLVDLLSYALLIAALFVRHFYIDETFTIARRMFALSLLVMYLRFLEVFLIHRKMGPTLIMIKEMLKDLLGFLILAVFVVLGVGIYYHANIWPDHQTIWNGDWTNWRIWTIIYYPYWQLYAELNLESLDGSDQSDCTNITSIWEADPSINRCPQEDWTVQAVAAIYLLFSNLLLVNLVIAMFSYTFERVQENSEKLWRFERYTVINDYDWRIPSPINLIFLPYRFIVRPGICCLKDDNDSRYHLLKEYRQNFQEVTALRILDKL
nr:transient receptor potential cation channel subfamily M member-like 2 isoform X2 [Crassostrea gigas]